MAGFPDDFVVVSSPASPSSTASLTATQTAEAKKTETIHAPAGDFDDGGFETVELGHASVVSQSNFDLAGSLAAAGRRNKSGFGAALGRFFMAAVHGFKRLFAPSVTQMQSRVFTSDQRPLPHSQTSRNHPVTALDAKHLGLANGVPAGDLRLKAYAHPAVQVMTDASGTPKLDFPPGGLRLDGIRQRAALQDCWCLSSIAAILQSQGAKYIQQTLLQPSQTPGCVTVCLRDGKFDIPLKQLTDKDGTSLFSDSAQWVQLLEAAMQASLIKNAGQYIDRPSIRMAMRSPMEALTQLMPEGSALCRVETDKSAEDKKTAILDALQKHQPVVLGHGGGLLSALHDDIAPQHAVTVIGARDHGNTLEILDPYGRVTSLSASALNAYQVFTVEPPAQQ